MTAFSLIYVKDCNVTFNFEDMVHVALFKTLKFMVLFCFMSSDQSEMVDWL